MGARNRLVALTLAAFGAVADGCGGSVASTAGSDAGAQEATASSSGGGSRAGGSSGSSSGSDATIAGSSSGSGDGTSGGGTDAGTIQGDAGGPCIQILSASPSGLFYGACLTTAAAGDVTQATYMKLDLAIVSSADHTTGQLTAQMTSLQRNPTNISQTVGATTSPPPVPISAQCTYVIEAGTTVIPAAANAGQQDLTLSNTRYRGKLLTPDETCAALDATITSPVTIDLTQGGNYCIYRRAPADGSITPFTRSDFQCPGAPPAM